MVMQRLLWPLWPDSCKDEYSSAVDLRIAHLLDDKQTIIVSCQTCSQEMALAGREHVALYKQRPSGLQGQAHSLRCLAHLEAAQEFDGRFLVPSSLLWSSLPAAGNLQVGRTCRELACLLVVFLIRSNSLIIHDLLSQVFCYVPHEWAHALRDAASRGG